MQNLAVLKLHWFYIKNWGLLTLYSGAWIWVLVYCLVLPGTLLVIQMRIQVAALTQAGLYIGNKLYDILSTLQDISIMAASFRTILLAWLQHQPEPTQPVQLHGIIVVP
jgi:hypothetical protein